MAKDTILDHGVLATPATALYEGTSIFDPTFVRTSAVDGQVGEPDMMSVIECNRRWLAFGNGMKLGMKRGIGGMTW